jgi:CheY-like chemotaxis protein
VLLAANVDEAVDTANRYSADAVVLAPRDGAAVLEMLAELKRRPRTRHLLAHVAVDPIDWQTARDAGAARRLPTPVSERSLIELFEQIARRRDHPRQTVLVVAPDEARRHDVIGLIGGDSIDVVSARGVEEARRILGERDVDCVVLDLPAQLDEGLLLLDDLASGALVADSRHVPVVLMPSPEPLETAASERITAIRDQLTVAATGSPQELFDATALYLHRAVVQRHEELHRTPAAKDPRLSGRHVLIVDDDVRNVFAVSAALEAQGMSVVYADNGSDGIRRLEANPDVELVLMDIMMPEMDGYETMAAIRAIPAFRELPIIALTAKALMGDREKAIAAGASDYITKPVDIDKLLAMIASWLDRIPREQDNANGTTGHPLEDDLS